MQNKKTKLFIYWVFSLILISDSVIAQDQPDIPLAEELRQLEAQISDSLSLEKIVDRIRATRNDPRLSLKYIDFYNQMIAKHPDIPNDKDYVTRLKGSRYNGLAWNNNRTNAELAFKYIDTAQYYYDQINFERGTYQNKYGLGVIYRNMGDNDRALDYFNEYYEHYSDPFDSVQVANVKFQIGTVLLQQGKLDESANALIEVVRLDEGLGRYHSQANNLNTLAVVYKTAKLFDKAEEAYEEALSIYLDKDDKEGQARIIMNHANMKMQIDQKAEAKDMYYQSIALDQSDYALGYSYENLGNWFLDAEQYDSSIYYLNKSYQLRKSFGNPRELLIIEHKLGKGYLQEGNFAKALPFLEKSFRTAQEQKEQEQIKLIADDLSKWHEQNGNYKKALDYKKDFIAAKDSLLDLNVAKQISEISTQYETEKKEQAIELLTAQNENQEFRIARGQRNLIFTLIGLGLLGILTFQIYRNRNKVNKLNQSLESKNQIIEQSLKEKEILLREIHHRVKNNLQVISSLLRIQSRSLTDEKAKSALSEGQSRVQTMALIHRDLYQNEQLTGIDLRHYFEQLVQNLFNTYKVSKEEINIESDIDDLTLDVDTVVPLGLIINELISNALKYAFPNGKGTIKVALKETSEGLELKVEDNGIGISDTVSLDKKSSFGYRLINTLVNQLEGKLDIRGEKGTRVKALLTKYEKAS